MLSVTDLRKVYRARVPGGPAVMAVDGVSFPVGVAPTRGARGAYGCGVRTLSAMLRLLVGHQSA